jgi:hypothetical protein
MHLRELKEISRAWTGVLQRPASRSFLPSLSPFITTCSGCEGGPCVSNDPADIRKSFHVVSVSTKYPVHHSPQK